MIALKLGFVTTKYENQSPQQQRQKLVNRLTSVLILSQVVKIEIEVQLLNPKGLWLYLSDANPIIKKWGETKEERDKEL